MSCVFTKRRLTVRCLTSVLASLLACSASASFAQTTTRFVADLSSSSVVAGGMHGSTATATGRAEFILTHDAAAPELTTLIYEIRLFDLDLDGLQTPGVGNEADDVTAIHVHDVNVCVMHDCMPGDTAGTLHVLNIFGMPRGGDDDDDMMFDPAAGLVTGLWENTDADPLAMPAPTVPVSDVVGLLGAGDVFLMVHTNAFPHGALGGFVTQVPEPSAFFLLSVFAACMAIAARRRNLL
jgi:hypothetical protein